MKPIFFILVVLLTIACKSKPKSSAPATSYNLEKVWETDTLLTTAESALYDSEHNVIYVSCINKGPREKDNNGFIAKVSPDGEIIEEKWVTGMHAPKGLGLYGNNLYAADIEEVIKMDVTTGEITDRISVPGLKMLNDITVDSEGKVYVTDMDDNKIYTITDGSMKVLVDSGLSKPNGLFIEPDRLLLVSMGSLDFVSFDLNSLQKTVLKDSMSAGDGIVKIAPETYIVSDWGGELNLISPDLTKKSLLNTKAQKLSCADIWFAAEKELILVPTFYGNTLAAYRLTR